MAVVLNICFDHSDLIYFTGQQVTGHVAFRLTALRTITCIKIKIKGKGRVKWTDLTTDLNPKGKLQFGRIWRSAEENYFKSVSPLDPQVGKFELPPGQYLYPFAVMLPTNIPASFIGLHGRVFYYAKATIMFENHDSVDKKIFFRVRNILNLNNFPALIEPVKVEKQRKFYQCCCFVSGKVLITASLPKSGYAKNEPIRLFLHAKNDSNHPIREIIVYLNRKTEWKAAEYRKYTVEKLTTVNIRRLNPNSRRSWSESIQIPMGDYPFIENCHIITMKYEVQIKIDTERLNCDMDLFLPISIGDVPINDESSNTDLPPSYIDVVGNAGDASQREEIDLQINHSGISVISS